MLSKIHAIHFPSSENYLPLNKGNISFSPYCISRKLFTLLELLIVIAIISILSALLLPAFKKANDIAKGIVCINNLKQCGLGVMQYGEDNNQLVIIDDGNYGWYKIYRNALTKSESFSVAYGTILNQGYINRSLSTCPIIPIKDEAVYGSRQVYGMPSRSSGEGLDRAVNNFPTGLSYLTLRLKDLKRHSLDLGIMDSLDLSKGIQMSMVNFMWSTGQASIDFRHNGKANGWFYDGHAQGVDLKVLNGVIRKDITSNTTIYYIKKNVLFPSPITP